MKRKNIKNDKVLRAITIGLATMIAATSAPLNVYAETEPATDDGADETPVGGEQNNGGGEQQATPIDVSEVTAADAALPVAAELVSTPVQADGVMTADAVAAPGGLIPVAETAVEGLLVLPAEGQTAEQTAEQTPQLPGVENALKQLETAAGSVQEVKEDLAGFEAALAAAGQAEAAPIETVYSVPAPAQEDGHVENSDNVGQPIPVLETSEPDEYYSDKTPVGGDSVDYYDKDVNDSVFHNSADDYIVTDDDEKKQPAFVKSIVDDYTEAYDNFQNFLSDNSDESKINAFDAAARADANLTKQENKIKELDEAIKDSAAAEQALKKAKDELETVKTIKSKYDDLMKKYFGGLINNLDKKKELLNEDGTVNAEECIAALQGTDYNNISKLKKGSYENDVNHKADNPGDIANTARELFCELVKQHIGGLGGTDIKIDFITEWDESGKKIKNTDFVSIDDAKNNVGNLNKIAGPSNIGGRKNRFTVKYTLNGVEETAYFNYVYKSTKADREETLDIANGIFYLAEIKGTYEKKVDNLTINDVNTRYDDYSLYANGGLIDKAVNAVKAAENKSAELKNAVNAIRNKVLGVTAPERKNFESDEEYNKALKGFNEECDSMFEDLKLATKYSRVKLNALRELIGERPEVRTGGGGEEGIGESGGESGDDDTTGGDETPGAAGGVVFDPSTGTFSAPAYGFGSTILPGFTGGPATGVLGVRTGGGTEADEGGAADSRTNVAPRADFSTVNKVLGSRQNKDNSQIVKKIKDNEIPLAEIPNMDDEVTMNWMWLLIIFLLGATGKKMYDEYKKKKEAEEAAKINK